MKSVYCKELEIRYIIEFYKKYGNSNKYSQFILINYVQRKESLLQSKELLRMSKVKIGRRVIIGN